MSAQIIAAAKAPDGYHFRVLLDTDQRVGPDEAEALKVSPGDPHPDWIYEITFGPLQPSLLPLHENGGHNETGEFLHACVTQHGRDLTEDEYLANILDQIPHQVELELHRRRGTSHHDSQRVALEHLHGKEL